MPKRLEYGFVKNEIELDGCFLLSNEYINCRSKIRYICRYGKTHSTCWEKWKSGRRCNCVDKIKKDINKFFVIKSSFCKEGYTILDDNYISAKTKIKYKCSKGHLNEICWNDWENGYRCPDCTKYSNKYSIGDIEKLFRKENYTLLTNKYRYNKQKLFFICSFGHKHSIILSHWLRGVRCKYCSFIFHSGSQNSNWKGGISKEPYCIDWTKEYKNYIKERDGNVCLNPVCNKTYKRLTVHHIDYTKKNCEPMNLITLCASCNSKANKNREWHKNWYQRILNKKYDYIYGD